MKVKSLKIFILVFVVFFSSMAIASLDLVYCKSATSLGIIQHSNGVIYGGSLFNPNMKIAQERAALIPGAVIHKTNNGGSVVISNDISSVLFIDRNGLLALKLNCEK